MKENVDIKNWISDYKSSYKYIADNLKQDFAVSVEKIIEDKRISKSHFADMLGTSKAYVSKFLGGNANLTIDSMAKVAHSLDYTLSIRLTKKNNHKELPARSMIDTNAVQRTQKEKVGRAKGIEDFKKFRDLQELHKIAC